MWKDLTLREKAEIMKMSVANGVTDINDIQELYDNSIYAEGGHLYDKAGPLNKAKQQPKYQYGIIEQILRENGVNFRVTSGARKPNQAGNAGKSSAHTYTIFGNSPGAIDIVPGVGSDWNTLFAQMNSPKVRRALAAYGLDVLNETNPNVMASTHATGPHLHVGRGIKGQSGTGIMYGGTTFGGGKGSVMPQYSRDNSYASMMQQQAMEPITLPGSNTNSPWLDYIGKIGQQRPITFNTPIGISNNLASSDQINIGPVDFSNIGASDELMSFIDPYTSKQALEYNLGLENNALWNSPYLLFNEHSAANGGHLFYPGGTMLLKDEAVNPLMQYVYGSNYEDIVRQKRQAVRQVPRRISSNQKVYDVKQQSDATNNRSVQRKIRQKQIDSPARRQEEQRKSDAAYWKYINERQGSIGPTTDKLKHPDYNREIANEVQQRYEQNEIAEQKAYNRRVLEHNILEGMEAMPWPSTIAGSLFNPNTHWYDPGSFFTNLYANDNRGFFNYNQATRDFYDANPEVGAVANLIGDFVVPGAAAKALKTANRVGKFAATDIGGAWKTMRYELAHPESQTYGIISNNFNIPKLNNKLRNFNNKLNNTALKVGDAEIKVIDNVKNGINNIKSRISSIGNNKEQSILKRTKDYGALSNDELNSISYQEAMNYPQFVNYSFMNASSLHPNFPAGTTRREIMEAMANVENNLASRPRFATSEFLGQDFSAQSVQMILNKIDRIQKKLIESGEQPGIIAYGPGTKAYLNPYAEINYGTKEAPMNPFTSKTSSGNYKLPYTRANQEYTVDDMAKWSDVQSVLDAITKRLQKIYDNVAPYNELVRNAGRDAFKAEVLPNGRIMVPSIGFLFKDGGEIRI